MSIDSQVTVEKMLSQIDSLPELPAVALKVSQLLDDPSTDAKALGDVIMLDPGLLTEVLKLCNSAQYSLSRKIATISEAVALLGHRALRQIVFTIISHGVLNREVNGYGLEAGALWENSVTCGVYAKHLAIKAGFMDTELAFIAGLLRDIGKIALDCHLSRKSQALQQIIRGQKLSFLNAEEQTAGANHSVVGAYLSHQWNLPEKLTLAIQWHHAPSRLPQTASTEECKLVALIHLADIFTMMTGTGTGIDGLMYSLDDHVLKMLDLPPDGLILEQWYAELLEIQNEIEIVLLTFGNH